MSLLSKEAQKNALQLFDDRALFIIHLPERNKSKIQNGRKG